MQFYNQLTNYLIHDCKLLNNTIGSKIKVIKTFLNFIINNELTDYKINLTGFKVLKEDIIISLTKTELLQIFYLKDLPEYLAIARDYFCFECFTGLRFSDIGRLQNENIKNGFIEIRTKKTRDALFVPINEFAQEILNKYKTQQLPTPLPKPYPNQVINKYIKIVVEKADINELTLIEKFSGANRILISKPKSQLISTHTGRRTFITLSHENGMSIEMIMKITGIKKWDTLKKYLKVSEKSKLIKMNEIWNKDVFSNNYLKAI